LAGAGSGECSPQAVPVVYKMLNLRNCGVQRAGGPMDEWEIYLTDDVRD
jgi:hypothetical protein